MEEEISTAIVSGRIVCSRDFHLNSGAVTSTHTKRVTTECDETSTDVFNTRLIECSLRSKKMRRENKKININESQKTWNRHEHRKHTNKEIW